MSTNTSFNLDRAQVQSCTSTGRLESSPVIVHSSSLRDDLLQLHLPTVTVSSQLVEDLLILMMLRLNPLTGITGAHLDQQQLLTLCLHMSPENLEAVRKVLNVSVSENLLPFPYNTRKAAVLLQSSLMRRFGTSMQVRRRPVRKDPALLGFIPHHITEAVLTTHKAESVGELTPGQTASDEESRPFSQFLPEPVKEEMFELYGSWIRHTKVFQRVFPRIMDMETLDYQQHISRPRLSNRDVVWVANKYFVGDFYEQGGSAALAGLDHSVACWSFTVHSGDHKLVSCTEVKPLQDGIQSLRLPQLGPLQLMAGDCSSVTQDVITDRALVSKSTIRCVLVELFKGQDNNSSKPPHQKNQAFDNDMVEHIHLLLQQETRKYEKNRLFLQNLKHLQDPKQEAKLSQEVCRPLRVALHAALPNTWLSRAALMKEAHIASLACSFIATEIRNHLKPTVSFAADTKPGDETPYGLNIPIEGEGTEPGRELSQLELHLHEEQTGTRQEVSSAAGTEPKTKLKKKSKFLSWLHKVVRSHIKA